MCALQLNGIHEERLDVFEVKIEESEKAGSHWEYNPGHLACAASALPLSYNNWNSPPPHPPQSSIYTAQVVLKCLSLTPGSHSVCAVRTPLG